MGRVRRARIAVVPGGTRDRDRLQARSAAGPAWPGLRVALPDGAFTAERLRDRRHLHGVRSPMVERAPGQRGFVVVENRSVVGRTSATLDHSVGLPRSRAGRLDVAVARLACAVTPSGVDALASPRQILETAA